MCVGAAAVCVRPNSYIPVSFNELATGGILHFTTVVALSSFAGSHCHCIFE